MAELARPMTHEIPIDSQHAEELVSQCAEESLVVSLPDDLKDNMETLVNLQTRFDEAIALLRSGAGLGSGSVGLEMRARLRDEAALLADEKVRVAARGYDLVDGAITTVDGRLDRYEAILRQKYSTFPNGRIGADFGRDRSCAQLDSVEVADKDAWDLRNEDIKEQSGAQGPSSTLLSALSSQQLPAEDEPVYCTCQQPSFGEMIACDDDDCAIEWFHYSCVGLARPPQGRWFCATCRSKH